MHVIKHNARVNLSTGERFGEIIGGGERREFIEGSRWSPEQLSAIREYERAMRDDVIPEIVRVMSERARLAAKSRRRFIL